ncbi:hypothetical protein JCM10450v2_004542 [Rhodotorula kratochvilovae]
MSTALHQRPRPTTSTSASIARSSSPRQRFINLLILTVVAGTTWSVLNTSAAATAFRSRLPAHTLTRLSESASTFPISLPFFADKRNVLNQWFVKRSWGWVTAVFLLFNLAVLLFPSPPVAQATSSSASPTPAIANGRTVGSTRLAVSSGHLLASLRRYLLASLYWFYLTQATWFGSTLGPSISFRILRSSGAVCVPSAISSDPLGAHAAGGSLGLHADGPAAAGTGPSPMVCTGARGEYWRGGHDVSGHAFMMVHCSLFLLELVYPLLPALFPGLFSAGGVGVRARAQRVHPAVKAAGFAAVAVIAASWWMLLMTSLFFHTPAEKLTGTAFGLLGWYISGL